MDEGLTKGWRLELGSGQVSPVSGTSALPGIESLWFHDAGLLVSSKLSGTHDEEGILHVTIPGGARRRLSASGSEYIDMALCGDTLYLVELGSFQSASNEQGYTVDEGGRVLTVDPDATNAQPVEYWGSGYSLYLVSVACDPDGGLFLGAGNPLSDAPEGSGRIIHLEDMAITAHDVPHIPVTMTLDPSTP
jgi:hypothetical protein